MLRLKVCLFSSYNCFSNYFYLNIYIYIYIYIYIIRKYIEISAKSFLYWKVPNYRLKICYASILNNFTSQTLFNHPGLIISLNQGISNLKFSIFHSSHSLYISIHITLAQLISWCKISIIQSHAIIILTQ